MGEITNIQWADATWNPHTGCKKVSKGCKYCYMYREVGGRFKNDPTLVKRASNATFNKPLTWEDPKTIFTCSWSDFFIKEADEWRNDIWDIIKRTPQHMYLILTKRPERMIECMPSDWGKGWDNVSLGVSIESQKTANLRIPRLFEVPALHRFLSVEPILEPIDLRSFLRVHIPDGNQIVLPFNQVIVGGESGNDTGEWIYRPSKLEWYKDIIEQCRFAKTPVFIKQLGTHVAKELQLKDRHGGDVQDPNFPPQLKIRQQPRKK